jgi:hypothetical protein
VRCLDGRETRAIEGGPAIFLYCLLQGFAASAQAGDGGGGGEVAGDVVEQFWGEVCE